MVLYAKQGLNLTKRKSPNITRWAKVQSKIVEHYIIVSHLTGSPASCNRTGLGSATHAKLLGNSGTK